MNWIKTKRFARYYNWHLRFFYLQSFSNGQVIKEPDSESCFLICHPWLQIKNLRNWFFLSAETILKALNFYVGCYDASKTFMWFQQAWIFNFTTYWAISINFYFKNIDVRWACDIDWFRDTCHFSIHTSLGLDFWIRSSFFVTTINEILSFIQLHYGTPKVIVYKSCDELSKYIY